MDESNVHRKMSTMVAMICNFMNNFLDGIQNVIKV